jgi:hypothetical protein
MTAVTCPFALGQTLLYWICNRLGQLCQQPQHATTVEKKLKYRLVATARLLWPVYGPRADPLVPKPHHHPPVR